MGREVSQKNPPNADKSLLCQTYKNKIPFTAHLAIGADIGHFHASADGAALGAASHTDFRLFCSLIKELNGGGVYLNPRFGGDAAGDFPKSRHRRQKFRFSARRFYHGEFRFHPALSPADKRRPATDGKRRGTRIFDYRTSRIYDSAACGAYFMR